MLTRFQPPFSRAGRLGDVPELITEFAIFARLRLDLEVINLMFCCEAVDVLPKRAIHGDGRALVYRLPISDSQRNQQRSSF